MSVFELARQPHLMNEEEAAELLRDGWQPEIIETLRQRGFRPCKPDPKAITHLEASIGITCGFLRQTSTPHLYITLRRETLLPALLEQIDTALFEAGYRHGYSALAGYFTQFTDRARVTHPRPEPPPAETLAALEKRLTTLEQRLTAPPTP